MTFACPGSQKFKQPSPDIVKCAFCGSEVELWTDEAEAKCGVCKKTVLREAGQGCLDWCRYARQCVGGNIYDEYMKNKNKLKKKEE